MSKYVSISTKLGPGQFEHLNQPVADLHRTANAKMVASAVQLPWLANQEELKHLEELFNGTIFISGTKYLTQHVILRYLNHYYNEKCRQFSQVARREGRLTLSLGGNDLDIDHYDHVCTEMSSLESQHRYS